MLKAQSASVIKHTYTYIQGTLDSWFAEQHMHEKHTASAELLRAELLRPEGRSKAAITKSAVIK